MWVVVGGHGGSAQSMAWSADGLAWNVVAGHNASIMAAGYGVLYDLKGLWVACGHLGSAGAFSIATSPDGKVWTGVPGSATLIAGVDGVAYGGGKWVIVGGCGSATIVHSDNGINCTAAASSTSIFPVTS
jgi:hypothetical protein